MVKEDIYDPLTEYTNVFRERFKEVAENTFDKLARESGIDVEQNRKTCAQLYKDEDKLESVKTSRNHWNLWSVFLWFTVVVGVMFFVIMFEVWSWWLLTLIGMAVVAALLHFFLKALPSLKMLKKMREELEPRIKKQREEAWEQMAPLNRLYDWDVLTRMMSETVPRLEFDPYFTTQRLADLEKTYNWDDSFNAERSVIYSHSGLINGNPFVICRTRKMRMGYKTYYGSLTIHWTTRERDSDGEYHTVHHSETLTADVTAPYPEYEEKTRLIYGNTAAPDLTFSREKNNLAGKEKSWEFKVERNKLRKKARDLEHADFAMLTNEEFEVAFNTSNRNNNQQFALLFTPLAQESMMKLLKDKEVGYGDDFNFDKCRMINTICADHMQGIDLDMNPDLYQNYDFDKAKKDFHDINAQYFRAIYFCMAPLLCVPMYQQIRPASDIYGMDMPRHSSFWEHEALANFWGQERFKHPECVTQCILKTKARKGSGDKSTVTVYAHGYRVEERLTYISKWGRDGYLHDVPVYWNEYLPVTGTGKIYMEEDNDFKDTPSIPQTERLEHIQQVLHQGDMELYRRHIASRV